MKIFAAVVVVPLAWLADSSTGIDPLDALKSIGIGALLAIVPTLMWLRAVRRIDKLETRVDELYDEKEVLLQGQITRERQIADEITPIIRDSTQALQSVLHGMDTVVDRVVATERRNDMDVGIRRLEHIYSAVADALEHSRPGNPDVPPTRT